MPRPDDGEIAGLTASPDTVVEARNLRGHLPMVTGRDLLWNVLGLVGPVTLAVLFWLVEPGGSIARWGAIVMLVAMLIGGPLAWREQVRPTTKAWPIGPAVLGAGLIAWGVDLSTWAPAGDRFFRAVSASLMVTALFLIGYRVVQWRAAARLEPVPRPVLASAPALAVLLALDQVAMARGPRIAEVLGMPEEMSAAWLVHLRGLRLVQGSLGDRYSITPAGRELLADRLGV